MKQKAISKNKTNQRNNKKSDKTISKVTLAKRIKMIKDVIRNLEQSHVVTDETMRMEFKL
jgi:ribosome-binding protein aMBF1 (putative translation factor)